MQPIKIFRFIEHRSIIVISAGRDFDSGTMKEPEVVTIDPVEIFDVSRRSVAERRRDDDYS